ncbi:S8 family serine peptidase [Alteribacillus bidgolensis]|uniref:Serine protease, subtilisin family n=1 Tax=Alteribacillus bidgolensis TaxID=930129 RepID=A0A1G8M662_9BACI|nr:S8 family serine peptidase [Alteribacillus bidgolensis]SDI63446.1 Serine protease, subtilisin family [Alteribacillus bidgolensis]
MFRRTLSVCAASALLFSYPVAGLANDSVSNQDDTYVVGFNEVLDLDVIKAAGGETTQTWERIEAAEVEMTEHEAASLASHPGISYVEIDKEVNVSSERSLKNWGLDQVNAPNAWDESVTGAGVDVAVIDTGISTSHPSLDVDGGYSAVDYTDSYDDDNGHGTHAAGIIGANQPESGLLGVAPEADLFAVKVLDENGNGSLTQMLDGIEWAIEEEMSVINMSFGTLTDSNAMKSMVDKAYENDIIVAAASGNRGESSTSSNRVEYPARYDSVIAVGAVDENNERAFFSASGEAVELAAPGVDIVSTYTDSTYGPLSGTSMATPFVAGAFALLKEAYPEKGAEALRTILQEEAKDLGEPGRDPRYGYGLLQIPDFSDASVDDNKSIPEESEDEPIEEPKEEDIEDNLIGEGPIETPDENEEISPPADLQSNVDYNDDGLIEVILSWDHTEDENTSHYQIYRNGEAYEQVNETTFIDFDVEPGTYTYEVTVVDADGTESEKSETVEVYVEEHEEEDTGFSWPEKVNNSPSFQDVDDDFWAHGPIEELSARGIITGSDGVFRPGEPVRRGQSLAMIGRLLDWDDTPVDTRFPDVDDSYFGSGFIAHGTAEGYVSGFSDGTFRPNQDITRGQMAAILGSVFELSKTIEDDRFSDVHDNTTGQSAIGYLAEQGIVSGYDDGTFRPGKKLSRAQFASILYHLGEHLIEE